MRHPALALLWHGWRLSRRWYLVMLAIALAVNLTIMNASPANLAKLPERHEILASACVAVSAILALFTTLLAISVAGRAGFPMRFEFRLPVSTILLVGMPMLLLGTLCASLYVIPLLLARILYGVPIPLVAGAALVATVATLLAAASWTTISNPARGVALVLAVSACARLLAWMQPFHIQNGRRTGEPAFDPDMLSFSAAQYLLLALLVLLLFAVTAYSVGLQRQDERWRLNILSRGTRTGGTGVSVGAMLDRATDLLNFPCPVSSPRAAELWLECKRLGVPMVALGLLFALLMPLLPWIDSLFGSQMARLLATAAPVVLFFTGVGIGIFNRRGASGGYMNPFEGTRGLGTLQLAGIQLGTLGVALVLGTAFIGISLWLSAPLYDDFGPLWSRLAALIRVAQGGNIAQQAGTATSVVVSYFAMMAFLFCLHSCSMFWGRKVMYSTLAFLLYAMIFAHTALTDESAGSFVAQNMWAFAVGTLVLTVLLIVGIVRLQLITLKAGAMTLLAWFLGLAAACLMLQRLGVHLPGLPSELKALNAALLTWPLTLLLGTVWCYDRLRHR